MKNERKVVSFILVLALIIGSYTTVYATFWSSLQNDYNASGSAGGSSSGGAATSSSNSTPPSAANGEANAQILNNLGLYNGTSPTTFNPDLGSALNRETGVVLLLRIFGMEAEARNMSDTEADSILADFIDADNVSPWARNYMALAIQQNIISGMPGNLISAHGQLSGLQYATMILRSLGYDANYSTAPQQYAQIGGLSPTEQSTLFGSGGTLDRGQLVGISLNTLTLMPSGSSTSLIQNLVSSGIVNASAANNPGFSSNPPAADATGNTDSSSSHHHSNSGGTDNTAPTYTLTAASIHGGGDTITLNFATAMNTASLTSAIYYSDNNSPSASKYPISTAHASMVWSNSNKTLAITLNEATDHSYIPAEKYICTMITANAVNGLSTTSSAVYTPSEILSETVKPQLSDWALDMQNKILTLTFNEMVQRGSVDVTNITLKATASTTTSTHALTTSTVTGTAVYTNSVSIDLSADFAGLQTASIGNTAASSYIALSPGAIMDIVGNGNTSTAGLAIDPADFTPDLPELAISSTIQNGTGCTSGALDDGDQIILDFSKEMTTSAAFTVHVSGSSIEILKSGTSFAAIQAGQAFSTGPADFNTSVAWSNNNTELVITLDYTGGGPFTSGLSSTSLNFTLYPAAMDKYNNGGTSQATGTNGYF